MNLILRSGFVMLFAFAMNVVADATPDDEFAKDRFNQLLKKDLLDPDFSNASVNRMVFAGINSKNPEIVELTVKSIGSLAAMIEVASWEERIVPPVTRRIQDVPGLKKFLIKYWTDGRSRDGFPPPRTDDGISLPSWTLALRVLAVYYPGDPEVHDFIWETSGDNPLALLRNLNIGAFRTPEADQLRFANLDAPAEEFYLARHAAKGLAMSQPSGSLEALMEQLDRRDNALPDIVEAIVAHGSSATPYLNSLESRLSGDGRFRGIRESGVSRIHNALDQLQLIRTQQE